MASLAESASFLKHWSALGPITPDAKCPKGNLVARFEQLCRERVPQAVAADGLGDLRPFDGGVRRTLQHGLVQVMSATLGRGRMNVVRVAGNTHCKPTAWRHSDT